MTVATVIKQGHLVTKRDRLTVTHDRDCFIHVRGGSDPISVTCFRDDRERIKGNLL